MRNQFIGFVFCSLILLGSCSDDSAIGPEIPDDPLAFYLVEGSHDNMDLKTIALDSIKKFGSRIIGFNDIVQYDTSNFTFEVTQSGKESFDSLYLARYAKHFPIAVVANGEFLYCIYISHGAVSSFADWYSLKPYYGVNYPNNFLLFIPPPFIISPVPDLRSDSRMLQVLELGNKLK